MKVAPKTDHDLIVSTIFKDDVVRLRELLHTLQNIDTYFIGVTITGIIAFTPLKWAIHFNRYKCAQVCIELGANINDASDGTSPLELVLGDRKRIDILRLLLESGIIIQFRTIPTSNLLQTRIHQVTHLRTELQATSELYEMIWLLVDHGDQLHFYVNAEHWTQEVIPYRNKIRRTALLACAMRMKNMDRNIMRLVGKQIWSTRLFQE